MNATPPLVDKIRHAEERFAQLLDIAAPDSIHVAWTGGKDSTTVLHLWLEFMRRRNLNAPLRAVNIDTGVKFPEILALRDHLIAAWEVTCHIARPDVDIAAYPLAKDVASCCAELKIAPLKRAIQERDVAVLLTGLRRDEHPSRAGRPWLEQRQAPPHWQCNPILEWSEMDVWAYILERGLPYCELYDQGYRSLGCMPCTTPPESVLDAGERSGRAPDKEQLLEQLRSLGYF